MRTYILIVCAVVVALLFNACKTKTALETEHHSQNALDWAGIYKAGDSAGGNNELLTVITLENDLTYRLQTAIPNEWDKATDTRGSFSWNKAGSEIELKDAAGDNIVYRVGENRLIEAASGKVLQKQEKETITEKYWKLIEINGQPLAEVGETNREPHIILREQDNRLSGSGGCNVLMGAYELNASIGRIAFKQVASTMMACRNMEVETRLLKVLELVDNYTLSADGSQLSLNKARMAPLARFEVVYLR